jgi:hypothetical protein
MAARKTTANVDDTAVLALGCVSASCKLSYLLFHTHNKQASYKLDFFILVSLVLPRRDNKKDENHASCVPHTHLAEML